MVGKTQKLLHSFWLYIYYVQEAFVIRFFYLFLLSFTGWFKICSVSL